MRLLLLSFLLFINGCAQNEFDTFFKPIVIQMDFDSISLYENSLNSEIINYSFQYHSWKLFENNKFYPLTEHPLAFFRGSNRNFPCYVNYGYSKIDSSIRSITFEWGNSPFEEFLSDGKQYNVSQDVSDYNTLFSKLFEELADKFGQPTNYDKYLIKSDSKKLYPAKPQIKLYERIAEWNKNSIYIKLRLNVTWRKSITLTRYWD